ncbi:TolC family protein [Prosthecobacter sp.]|uniref:TolC family protein n=1 Tax=Prosthecobacter sp. TaxID=1965333 RepID=UPI0037845151
MKFSARILCPFLVSLLPALSMAEPVSVNSLVLKALITHPELRFYEAQIDVARGGKTKAGEIKNPDMMIGVGNWRLRDLATNYVTDGPTWAVQLTQTFDWPGRLTLRKAIAQKDVELAQLGFDQFRAALAGRVRTIAWKLLAAQEQTRAADEVAKRFKSLADVLLQRDPAGAAPRLEARIIQASALTLGAEATLARNELAAARFELNQLLGQKAEEPVEITMEKLTLNPPPPIESLMAEARRKNFALRARFLDVEQQGYHVELAKNERWPSITVQPYMQKQTTLTRETQVGIGVSIPLPLWNRNKGAIDAAQAKQVQAEVMLTAQMRQLERDVAAQASHYRIHVEELAKWPADTLESFRKAAAEADEHYRLGALPLATYTELQRQYIASVKAVLTSQMGAVDARLQLEQLTGTAVAQ